jgi:N-acetylmuramic acid 6-phosphate (MurNAc-6-P) etherase
VDITGGKTPMSVGAFMAAEERGATSLYVTAPHGDNGLNTAKARIRAISTPALR